MDIIEQLESKIRSSMGRYDELKSKINELEEENSRLKAADQERTDKLERLLSSIDSDSNSSHTDATPDFDRDGKTENNSKSETQTIDEGEDIF